LRRLAAGTFAVVASGLLLGAPAAPAAVGDLAFESCIASAGLSGCTDPPADSLDNPSAIAFSPDGSSVYVPSVVGDSISHFTRTLNGSLAFESCIANAGASGCTDPSTDSLDQANAVAVSPDGNSVYVASAGLGDSITHFTRTASGSLVFESCVAEAGASGCTDPAVDSLSDATDVAVSPDGNSVFVTSATDDAITHFTRTGTGSLAFESCIAEAGLSGCTDPATDSLDRAAAVALSSDGGSVYVASSLDDSITHFTRTGTGSLVFESCIAEGGLSGCADPPIDSVNQASAVAVSPDGNSVYVVSIFDDSITHFTRTGTGSLAFESCIAEGGFSGCSDPSIDSLDEANGVAVSPDGSSVYVAALADDSIAHFPRAANGSLAFGQCIADAGLSGCADPAIDSLNGSLATAVSPDGSSVYVAGAIDDSITHFKREGAPPPAPEPQPQPQPEAGDTNPPDTQISAGPKSKTKKKTATFSFTSTEPGSTFQCSLDDTAFEPCTSPKDVKVKKGKHTFEVRATDAAGNTDPTPATRRWTVKRKRKR
jgi:DNA-binding beta-propeller fold protein YncE